MPPVPEPHLRVRLRQLAKDKPRCGYRRLHALLTRQGHVVNDKRVQYLSRGEGQPVRASRRKRALLGTSTAPADQISPPVQQTPSLPVAVVSRTLNAHDLAAHLDREPSECRGVVESFGSWT